MSARGLLRGEAHEAALRGLRFTEQVLAPTDGLHAFDPDLRFIYWSAAMERISGLVANAVLGARAPDVLPFLAEGGIAAYHEALAGRRTEVRGLPFAVPETGRSGFYDALYSPLRGEDGAIAGGVALVRDVTEARITEAALRETETRFQNMADASPVLLWMSGTDSLCTFFNSTWLAFTGRTLEQEWGVGWCEGVHHEDLSRCMDTYVAAFNERRVFEMEYRLRRADGEYRWILDRGTPRYSPDGRFAGYIGSCVDITDRKDVETTLRKAVRERDDFLDIASHELRTPLTALQLQLGSLARTLATRPEEGLASGRIRKNTELAAEQAKRLGGLVNQLLDVSRINAGRLELAREPVDGAQVIRDVIDRLAHAAADAGCRVEARLAPDVVGNWDRLRIEQIVTNLLGNAIKYGAGQPIEVELSATPERAVLTVRDHGIGIAPADQPRIFERFERAVSARHYGGFGLGLWIARRFVEAHGGRIAVASDVGAGAAFTVELPR